MNHEPINEDWIPDRNAGYQLSAPSASLREKVLREASLAWAEDNQSEELYLWPMPLLRLVASITIAVLLVIFAHMGDQYSLARWRPSKQMTVSPPNSDLDDQWPELHPGLMRIRDLAATSTRRIEPMDLRLYLQLLQKITDDANSASSKNRDHTTEFFLNPRLQNHLINSTEILES